MGIGKVKERCLSAPTKEDALSYLEWRYWNSNITASEYNKLKTEIYKEFKTTI